MSNQQIKENISYSKVLSCLFSSNAVIALSILCLLNNLSLDLYSLTALLKVVLPASFCFWLIGFFIGRILDTYNGSISKMIELDEQKAYEIPSIFSDSSLNDSVDNVM